MNGRVARKIRSTVFPKGSNVAKQPRQHFAKMASKTAVRPSCYCDDQRRFYQQLKQMWQRVPRNLRRINNIKVTGVQV